jgi:hypothetical protein
MFIRNKIQRYFGDALARFALVVAVSVDHEVTSLDALREIFDLSLEMVDYDRNSGFKLLSKRLDPYWCPAMNDLLEDPQGEFFIDDNQYADIALHIVKYMSTDSKYVPPAGYPDLVINVTLQIISYFSSTWHYSRDVSNNPGQVVHSA